ncbi:MAG: alginate lyase family protein [Ginsengibacter sp.]
MSLAEIGYRAQQYFQKQKEKKGILNFTHKGRDYDQILVASNKSVFSKIPLDLAQGLTGYCNFEFFGYSVNLNQEIDWHLDISTGKRFPVSFSKDINIRSDKFGNAKVIWEINRLQFLLPLAIRYSLTKDKTELQHWMQLVISWVNNNPYLKGINWYSNIEVNIRLIVWYFCWQVLWQDEELKKDKEFNVFAKETWLPAIYEHCIYSFQNPSKYSSANNHLVAEYSGLFIASCCWKFAEAENWKTYAMQGLEKEIKIQFSPNGINNEQAAEYIQFITDFFLIPYAVGAKIGINFSNEYKQYLYNISVYIINLLDVKKNYRKYGDEDDGKVLVTSSDHHFDNFSSLLISSAILFNNERFKSIGKSFDLKNWLLWGNSGRVKFEKIQDISLNLTSSFYENDGQFFFRKADIVDSEKEIYMHFDAAPLGFLSIAAHGHADALSLNLTVDGYPLIVDIGTYTYHTEKEWRNYFVSTLGHNTICVDKTNQSCQAGPTMWLDHYKTNLLKAEHSKYIELVSASHSGYKKLGCTHKRTIKFNREDDIFTITDEVGVNSKQHNILQPWHLHPDVNIEGITSHEFILQNKKGGRKVNMKFDEQLQIDIATGQTDPILGWYSSSFLIKEPTSVLTGKLVTTSRQMILLNTSIHIL